MDDVTIVQLEKVTQGGSLSDGEIGFFDAVAADGKAYRFVFEPHMLTPIREGFSAIQGKVNEERKRSGKATVFQRTVTKTVSEWQLGEDSSAKVALIRTVFHDQSHQDTPIPLEKISEIVEFLCRARDRFQNSQ